MIQVDLSVVARLSIRMSCIQLYVKSSRVDTGAKSVVSKKLIDRARGSIRALQRSVRHRSVGLLQSLGEGVQE